MKILAIESSCDETACAVVEDGRTIRSSYVYSQIEEHRKYGGVVPEIASRRHIEQISHCTQRALEEAELKLEEVDAVAVTYAPGLIGALLVGVNFAKGLALAASKPLIPVHHIRGHIAANYLAFPELAPPFLCLVISGGHTHIIEALDYTRFHIVARTRDDAAGEAFDKAARAMGFSYPGGVTIDRAAQRGNIHALKLPRPKVEGNELDMSFSGLKTAVINTIHNAQQKGEPVNTDDMAASFNHTVAEILTDRVLRAAKLTGHQTIVLAGGVSANSMIRSMISNACQSAGYRLFVPPLALCGDNAAMIGAQAYYEFLDGNLGGMDLNGIPSLSVETSFCNLKNDTLQ